MRKQLNQLKNMDLKKFCNINFHLFHFSCLRYHCLFLRRTFIIIIIMLILFNELNIACRRQKIQYRLSCFHLTSFLSVYTINKFINLLNLLIKLSTTEKELKTFNLKSRLIFNGHLEFEF